MFVVCVCTLVVCARVCLWSVFLYGSRTWFHLAPGDDAVMPWGWGSQGTLVGGGVPFLTQHNLIEKHDSSLAHSTH